MKYLFDWMADKNGWKILIVEGKSPDAEFTLMLNDKEAVELYEFIKNNFDVGEE